QAVPAKPRADERAPGLSLRARRRRRGGEGEGGRLRRGVHGAPAGQSGLRAAAAGQPQPDLFGDDSRGLRQEPERLSPGGSAVKAWWIVLAPVTLMASACATSEAPRPAQAPPAP